MIAARSAAGGLLAVALSAARCAGHRGAPPSTPQSDGQPTAAVVLPPRTAKATSRSAEMRGPALVYVTPSNAISVTARPVHLPVESSVGPGPWSPSGDYLVGFVVRDGPSGPVGHLITIDTRGAALLADLGDMEMPLAGQPVAAWLPDDTLLLARQDEPLISPDGQPKESGLVFDAQPKALSIAPGGGTVYVQGTTTAWLVGENLVARRIDGLPADVMAWSWRQDGKALATVAADGRCFHVDAASAAAQPVAGVALGRLLGAPSAPGWLADGRWLLAEPRQIIVDGRPLSVNLIVDPESGEIRTLHSVLNLTTSQAPGQPIGQRLSPDGRYLLYPSPMAEHDDGPFDILFDVTGATTTLVPGLVGAVWAPTSDRLAYLAQGRLAIWPVGSSEAFVLSRSGTVSDCSWSPDGRWLAYRDQGGALWLTASDGSAAPRQLADRVDWSPQPTWSTAGQKLAASVEAEHGGAQLVLFEFEAVSLDESP